MSRLVPTVGFIAILCSLGCQTAENPLLGVWQVQVIENRSGDSSTENSSPQPSLAIFIPTHYSFTWMPGVSAMRSFNEPWSPTAEEKIQRYGEIIGNSGAYTLAASTLTLRPLVSRIPEFMGGGWLEYEYRVDDDTLWLTFVDEYSYDGVQAPWVSNSHTTLTLKRIGDLGG